MKFDHTNCKKIKGDASFRIFYRKKISKKTSIVVVAKKEKKKNLLIYDAINRLLIKNKIIAPKLLSESIQIMAAMREDAHIDGELFELFLTSGVYEKFARQFLMPSQIDDVDISEHIHDGTKGKT